MHSGSSLQYSNPINPNEVTLESNYRYYVTLHVFSMLHVLQNVVITYTTMRSTMTKLV